MNAGDGAAAATAASKCAPAPCLVAVPSKAAAPASWPRTNGCGSWWPPPPPMPTPSIQPPGTGSRIGGSPYRPPPASDDGQGRRLSACAAAAPPGPACHGSKRHKIISQRLVCTSRKLGDRKATSPWRHQEYSSPRQEGGSTNKQSKAKATRKRSHVWW